MTAALEVVSLFLSVLVLAALFGIPARWRAYERAAFTRWRAELDQWATLHAQRCAALVETAARPSRDVTAQVLLLCRTPGRDGEPPGYYLDGCTQRVGEHIMHVQLMPQTPLLAGGVLVLLTPEVEMFDVCVGQKVAGVGIGGFGPVCLLPEVHMGSQITIGLRRKL